MAVESPTPIADTHNTIQHQETHLSYAEKGTIKTESPELNEDVIIKLIKLIGIGSNVDIEI